MSPLKFFYICLTLVLLSFTYALTFPRHSIPRDMIVPVVEADSVPDSILPDVEAQVIPKPKTNDGNNNIRKVDTPNSVSVLPNKGTSRITQTETEHVKKGNGSVYATDIVYSTENVPFPDTYGDYVIYHIGKDERIGDYVIIRHGQDRWLFGHTVTSRSGGEYVDKTDEGKVLGQSNVSGVATARHTHIERWKCPDIDSKMKDCQNVSSTGQVAERNQAIIEQRGWVGDGGGRKESDNLRNKEMAERREGKEVGGVDLDKLAKAVAKAETSGCTTGTALSKNNCHGIKSGNTYKCKSPKGTMCHFDTKEESFIAFKVIWGKWYKTLPTTSQATVWTGADKADHWRRIVLQEYNNLNG